MATATAARTETTPTDISLFRRLNTNIPKIRMPMLATIHAQIRISTATKYCFIFVLRPVGSSPVSVGSSPGATFGGL
jgi:hypothetical protein